MNSIEAFANGDLNRGKELMVFDWHKAAEMINKSGAITASAGLTGDWEWTGGVIFRDGKICKDDYTYLASTWATPEIEIDGVIHDCFIMQSESDGWDSGTKWPDSAVVMVGVK